MKDTTATRGRTRRGATSRRGAEARRSIEAVRLEMAYRELGFTPMRAPSATRPFSRDFVFTPPSFLPNVPYTVTTLAGV